MGGSQLPWSISLDNPVYRASLDRFHTLNDAFTADFRSALAGMVENTPGLNARYLDQRGRAPRLPWLYWDEQSTRGGYWVACGLSHEPDLAESAWRTFLWLHYLEESEDGDEWARDERLYPLGERFNTRNAVAVARAVRAAVTNHRATFVGTTGDPS